MDASVRGGPATRRGVARIASMVIATAAQSGVTLVQQGVVIVGVFFIFAYHLTLAQMGAVVSLVSVGWMISALLTGMLMDAFGPRVVQFGGSLLMSVSALLISFAHSLPIICVLLIVLGLGVSVTSLAGTVMVIYLWPREERGLPFGIRQMGVPLGAMAASLILPSLAAAYGLSTLFRIFAVTLLVVGVGFSLALPRRSRNHSDGPRARPGVAMLRTLREMRQIAFPSLTGFLLAFGQYTLLSISIPMLHTNAALTIAAAGVILAVAQLGGAIARIGLGAITDRSGGRLDLTLGFCAATGAALALVIAFLPLRLPFAVLAMLWLLLGVTMVGWNALIVMWASERVAEQNSGAAVGLTTSFILLGGILAPPFMGGVIQVTHVYGSAWITLAVILSLAGVVVWRGFRHQRTSDIVTPFSAAEATEAVEAV